MAYSTAIALVLGAAAWALEGVVRERGWPVRWLWMSSLAGSVLIPVVSTLSPSDGAADPTGVIVLGELSISASRTLMDSAAGLLPATPDLDPWLLAAWAALALYAAVALTLSYIGLRRGRSGWRRSTVDGTEVWITDDTGPAVVGFLESRILLPAWVLGQSPDERAMVLAHESEHLRAGDPRLLLGALAAAVALPWNLAIWWQGRRLRDAIEFDCDARVLRRGIDPRLYGRLLLNMAEKHGSHRLAIGVLGESTSSLERRLRHMLIPGRKHWLLRSAGAASLAASCLFVACETDAPSSPSEEAAPAAAEAGAPAAMPDFAYELSALDQVPRLTNQGEIASVMERLYPRSLQDAGIGGTVMLQFVIAADGKADMSSVEVLESSNDLLTDATIGAVERFQFSAGRYQGRNVRTLIQMPVTWQPAG